MSATVSAEPARCSDAEILGALSAGRQVRAVFHYKGMTLVNDKGQPETAPDAVGGMPLTARISPAIGPSSRRPAVPPTVPPSQAG